MSRGLSSSQVALTSRPHRIFVPLVELFYDSGTLRFALCEWDIEWNGNTYHRGNMIEVKPYRESTGSIEGLEFTVTGLNPDIIAIAAGEPYQGRICRVLKAFLDPDTYELVGNPRVWFPGRIRTQPISETNNEATVTVVVEHYDAEFERPNPIRLSDANQQSRFPGDRGCEYAEQMTEHRVVWPTKEAQRR